jgi:sugar/nucleoside kinase (ribokinase family)
MFGGGSAANTAAALSRLGVDCAFVGSVGDDTFGRLAVESLAEAGVGIEAVQVTDGSPTVTVIAVVKPDGDRLIYVWPPTRGAHGALRPETALDAAAGARWLHVSGICLRVSPAREALLAVMTEAQTRGIPVSFDLNLRLENWGWDDGFRDIVESALERSDLVMGAASDEVVPLAGIDDPVEAARSLATDDRLVIARLGADGAVACSAAGTVAASGFQVPVADTLGAGDAFNAGFIAARLRGADVAGSLEWGNAVAALTITRSGARSSPARLELEAFLLE